MSKDWVENGAKLAGISLAAAAVTAGIIQWSGNEGRSMDDDKWSQMLDRVLPSIVVIRANYVRSFDGELSQSGSATGFVVDAKKGIILTNRHVVSTGPVIAEAIFANKEEVELLPIYRDPVHDFGFFKFNPQDIKFMSLTEIQLCPSAAHVGTEIRVVGNDDGEKLSILSGVLARLDRNAPYYGSEGFNDFNTFYLSAASNTSGGSSGSPVLNIRGQAVALNAGGSTQAASSFYLPLDRVVPALAHVQAGSLPPRGTERIIWKHETYDELKKRGLRLETEERMRKHPDKEHPQRSGLLVVEQLIPGTPAAGKLDVGDVLIAVDDEDCTTFVDLEDRLDRAVDEGRSVSFTIERGGVEQRCQVQIEDLHQLTPKGFLEAAGAIIHSISLMQARNGNIPLDSGVYVAQAGFVLDAASVYQHTVITQVGSMRTPTIEALEAAFVQLADGETTTVRYFNIGDQHNEQVGMIRMNHRWFPMEFWERNDSTGKWDSRPCKAPAKSVLPEPSAVHFLLNRSEVANKAISSLCKVSFAVFQIVDGIHDRYFSGAGLVVDAEHGIVVTDRNTVVGSLGEVSVTFPASMEIPARVLYMHPTHNFAVLQYDVRCYSGNSIQSATLCTEPVNVGDALEFVGLCKTNADACFSQRVLVSEVSCVNISQANVPRFRAMNEDIYKFDEVVNRSLGGVLVDSQGRVRALWLCYSFYSWNEERNRESFHAMAVDLVCDIVQPMIEGCRQLEADPTFTGKLYPLPTPPPPHGPPMDPMAARVLDAYWPKCRSLELGLRRIPLSTARTNLKLPIEWVEKLQQCHVGRSQVLSVSQLLHGSPSHNLVSEGDLLLAVNDKPVVTFRDVEEAVDSKETVKLTILRDAEVKDIELPTMELDGVGTSRVMAWAGLLLQEPYRAVREVSQGPSEVYCSYFMYGSPASFYGVKAGRYITEVKGAKVHTLDDLKRVVATIKDGEPVSLRAVDLQGQAISYTMKMDYVFFPTAEMTRDPSGEQDWTWEVV